MITFLLTPDMSDSHKNHKNDFSSVHVCKSADDKHETGRCAPASFMLLIYVDIQGAQKICLHQIVYFALVRIKGARSIF